MCLTLNTHSLSKCTESNQSPLFWSASMHWILIASLTSQLNGSICHHDSSLANQHSAFRQCAFRHVYVCGFVLSCGRVQLWCLLTLPRVQQPIMTQPHVCVCVCPRVLLLARNGFLFFQWLCMQIDETNVSSYLWHFCICSHFWIHFHLFGAEISSTPGKTSSGNAGKRVWHPAREGKTQQSMLGIMTKNNGVLPHNWGSSILIYCCNLEYA